MRSLNVGTLNQGNEEMIRLRDQLVKEAKERSRSKGKSSRKVVDGDDVARVGGSPLKEEKDCVGSSVDAAAAIDSLLQILSLPIAFSIDADSLVIYILALEVLGHLLTSMHHQTTQTSVASLFTGELLDQLTSIVYASLDSGPAALLTKGRIVLAELLVVAVDVGSDVVTQALLARITVAPWASKRTLTIFEAMLKHLAVDELVSAFGETEHGAAGLLKKLLHTMDDSDDVAVLAGRISTKWIGKVWATDESEDDGFWIDPVAAIIRTSSRGRASVSQYILQPIFQERKSTFKQLLSEGGFALDGDMMNSESAGVEYLEGVLSILKIANSLGLIEGDGIDELEINKIRLPTALLSTCLSHSSSSLRCSALSLIVVTSTPSLALPSSAFELLKTLYLNSAGDESGEFRMKSLSLSGALLTRFQKSSHKAHKKGNAAYVEEVKSFILWWFESLLLHLNPASPFRIRVNTLRLLDLILQAGLDQSFLPLPEKAQNGYSTYRTIAKTAVPRASLNHSWPFSLSLVTPRTAFTLLRLLKSTYTALRGLAIALLERFPSPLPGYDDATVGDAKVQQQLLEPALSMMKSGREAEASAGAVILGLVHRKWVLEGGCQWDLGMIGGWRALQGMTSRKEGSAAFSFLNDIMDLAEFQLDLHSTDLARAASTQPMHGTLLTLRHLFSAIPLDDGETSIDERRTIFLRALRIVERVWDVTSIVLAAPAPEGSTADVVTAGNEETRALGVVEDREMDGDADGGDADGDGDGDGSDEIGSGGPIHKVILSATWRAMKEASELLETILRLPAELNLKTFKSIWTLEDVHHIGSLYSTWLSKVRHRGCMMAIHPTYSRTASTLLACKGWPEVQALPVAWLNGLIDSITSQKISTTRRSAGLPFSMLAIFSAIMECDRTAFDLAFVRLFEIAESKTDDIGDESRVHAMNTLRTVFLDGKSTSAVASYIERAFVLSIGMFWSTKWICRNVAMMLYAALVTRAFGTRRLNLDRDNASLLQRLPLADFFSRYPSLHAVLLSELVFCSREHLNDMPTVDLNSSLFSILMMLSLLQSPNRVAGSASLSGSFISVVRGCATSRVWKIRDAAADALTGLVPSDEVAAVCLQILDGVDKCGENEMHGRLTQVLRLLEGAAALPVEGQSKIAGRIEGLSNSILDHRRSFSVRTTFLHIARVFAASTLRLSAKLYKTAHQELEASRSWSTSTMHLPSAENFVTACFLLVLLYDPSSTTLLNAGIASPFLSVQKETLDFLASTAAGGSVSEDIAPALIDLALSHTDPQECRIQAIELLASSEMRITSADDDDTLISELISIHLLTVIVPISEVLLPWIAHLIAQEELPQLDVLLEILDASSSVTQSIEMRENAALALLKLANVVIPDPAKLSLFNRLILRLVQDDNLTVREYAGEIVAKRWNGGGMTTDRRGIAVILQETGAASLEELNAEFVADLAQLSTTSSLLFVVEQPNIYKDDLLETSLVNSPVTFPDTPLQLCSSFASLSFLLDRSRSNRGPLGVLANSLLCKWAYRLVSRVDRLTPKGQKVVMAEYRELVDLLRSSI